MIQGENGLLKVKDIMIGEGRPKICVPLTGTTKEELIKEAKIVLESGAELAEIRIDYFVKENGLSDVCETLKVLRKELDSLPVIFTFRTKNEGGECEISEEDYERLILDIAYNGLADIIDIEYNMGKAHVTGLCYNLKKTGVISLVSNHDFQKTISKDDLKERMCDMEKCGADIVKVAMMPQTKADVFNLLEVTEDMSNKLKTPVITMSMGKLGAISRLCGEFSSSAVTFATVGKCSAPGQMPVDKVKECLELIHNQMK